METIRLIDPDVEVELRRSARARRLSLRVSRLDGRVSLTLPRAVPLREGERFVQSRAGWIAKQLALIPPLKSVRETLTFRGETLRVVAAQGRAARRVGEVLYVPEGRPKALPVWLKEEARDLMTDASARYARTLGKPYTRITLRDTRSRWGSCSSAGALMYSWRLIMAPDHVSDYVAAHEVAHLVHMDHSPAFWAVVSQLRPDWRRSRDWLRTHGGTLHRVQFDD